MVAIISLFQWTSQARLFRFADQVVVESDRFVGLAVVVSRHRQRRLVLEVRHDLVSEFLVLGRIKDDTRPVIAEMQAEIKPQITQISQI